MIDAGMAVDRAEKPWRIVGCLGCAKKQKTARFQRIVKRTTDLLLKLAIELHAARLEEIPRKIEEAHERRKAHEAARRAWLEDQKAFAGDRDAR